MLNPAHISHTYTPDLATTAEAKFCDHLKNYRKYIGKLHSHKDTTVGEFFGLPHNNNNAYCFVFNTKKGYILYAVIINDIGLCRSGNAYRFEMDAYSKEEITASNVDKLGVVFHKSIFIMLSTRIPLQRFVVAGFNRIFTQEERQRLSGPKSPMMLYHLAYRALTDDDREDVQNGVHGNLPQPKIPNSATLCSLHSKIDPIENSIATIATSDKL